MRVQYIFILIIFPALAWAQDFKKDLTSMKNSYLKNEHLSMKIKATVFNTAGNQISVQEIVLKKKGEDFIYLVAETEMLIVNDMVLMINNKEKKIILKKIKPAERERLKMTEYTVNIDSLIQGYDSLKYELTKDQSKHYTIYTSKKAIKRTDLWLDGNSDMLKKMAYQYNPKLNNQVGKAEMVFTNHSNDSKEDEKLFSSDRIVIKENNIYKTTKAYSGYKLNIVTNEN